MQMQEKKYLWLLVTKDKYELPLAVADTAKELAIMTGTTKNNIVSQISRGSKKSMYRRVRA